MQLLAFLTLYAAAPFTHKIFEQADLLGLWGVGGLWLACSVWFICDRDFRAYAIHLKERIYCLHQIAILRDICMSSLPGYLTQTLMPFNGLKRTHRSGSDFPERLSASQLSTASYFFKFITLFPAFYLFLFFSFLVFPELMTGSDSSMRITSRVALTLSGLGAFWIWASAKRCMMLQREAYTARRISKDCPWPNFPDSLVRFTVPPWRKPARYFLIFCALALTVLNFGRGYLVLKSDRAQNVWSEFDLGLAVITFVVLAVGFVFTEWDIRHRMRIAKSIGGESNQDAWESCEKKKGT